MAQKSAAPATWSSTWSNCKTNPRADRRTDRRTERQTDRLRDRLSQFSAANLFFLFLFFFYYWLPCKQICTNNFRFSFCWRDTPRCTINRPLPPPRTEQAQSRPRAETVYRMPSQQLSAVCATLCGNRLQEKKRKLHRRTSETCLETVSTGGRNEAMLLANEA